MTSNNPQQTYQRCDELLQYLRSKGWVVAIHNDYRMNGEPHTFWLFTHASGNYIVGEGKTDVEALQICVTHSNDNKETHIQIKQDPLNQKCPNGCLTEHCPVFPEDQARMLKEKAWCDEWWRETYSIIESCGCASYTNADQYTTPVQKPGCYITCPFDDLCANDIEKIKAIEREAVTSTKKHIELWIDENRKNFRANNCEWLCDSLDRSLDNAEGVPERIGVWKINPEDHINFTPEELKDQSPEQILELLKQGWELVMVV